MSKHRERQKLVATALIENAFAKRPLTNEQLLVQKGNYPLTTAKSKGQSIVTHPGIERVIDDFGFNEEAAKRIVANIAHTSETDIARLKATDQIFKVLGTYAPEKRETKNLNVDISIDPKSQVLANEYEEKLKAMLLKE